MQLDTLGMVELMSLKFELMVQRWLRLFSGNPVICVVVRQFPFFIWDYNLVGCLVTVLRLTPIPVGKVLL